MKRLLALTLTLLALTACGASEPKPHLAYPVTYTDMLVTRDQGTRPILMFNVTADSPVPFSAVVISATCDGVLFMSAPLPVRRGVVTELVMLNHYGPEPLHAPFGALCLVDAKNTAPGERNTWLDWRRAGMETDGPQ